MERNLTTEEMLQIAQKSINEHEQGKIMPVSYLAIIRGRGPEFMQFKAGITKAPGNIDISVRGTGHQFVYELWELGRNAAHQMYKDLGGDLRDVDMLGAVLYDNWSGHRFVWISSPGETTIELCLLTDGHTRDSKAKEIDREDPVSYVHFGFRKGRLEVEIEEALEWN